jgi:hypothetical protein
LVASAREVPFYGADGSHRVTLPVEVNADGVPPTAIELIGPDETGRLVRWHYELGRRPPRPDGAWAYLETARHPYEGAATGVEDAQARRDLDSLRRLLAADDWPPDYLD